MASEVTFRMVNDQTGEEVSATLADELDFRAQGYRVLDVSRYDSAMGAFQDSMRRPAPVNPHAEEAEKRTYEDALIVARRTFPDAEADGEEGAALDDVDPGADTGSAANTAAATTPLTDEQRRERFNAGTISQLRNYAEQRGVDLTGATLKDQIVDRLMAADAAAS